MLTVGQEIEGFDLRSITELESSHFQIKLLILGAVTAIGVFLTVTLPSLWWIAPSLLIGLMYAHAVELQHQCLHNTAFRGRPWNRRVGVLLGLPTLVSYSDYQNSHMRHHKLLGTPEDREFFNYGYESLTTVRALIPHIFMVRHYRDVAVFISKALVGKITRPEAPHKIAVRIRNEYLLMGIFLLAMLAITFGFHTLLFVKLWLIPALIAVPTHAFIELPEHIACDCNTVDVLVNTRTIKASKFAVWFTDGNNYHVEHHWLPGVPNHKFPELHKIVVKNVKHLETSYWSFYSNYLKLLYRNAFAKPDTKLKSKGVGA
jgi:fatty acid desaturase